MLKFAFERAPRTIGIKTGIFFIIFPDPLKFITIRITIKPLPFSLPLNNMPLVVLVISKLNLGFTFHQIFSEEAFISSGVRPTILT